MCPIFCVNPFGMLRGANSTDYEKHPCCRILEAYSDTFGATFHSFSLVLECPTGATRVFLRQRKFERAFSRTEFSSS